MVWSVRRAWRRILRRSSEGREKKGKGWVGGGRGAMLMSAKAWEREVIEGFGICKVFLGVNGLLNRTSSTRIYPDMQCTGICKVGLGLPHQKW